MIWFTKYKLKSGFLIHFDTFDLNVNFIYMSYKRKGHFSPDTYDKSGRLWYGDKVSTSTRSRISWDMSHEFFKALLYDAFITNQWLCSSDFHLALGSLSTNYSRLSQIPIPNTNSRFKNYNFTSQPMGKDKQ